MTFLLYSSRYDEYIEIDDLYWFEGNGMRNFEEGTMFDTTVTLVATLYKGELHIYDRDPKHNDVIRIK